MFSISDAAGFSDSPLKCNGVIHQDCSFSFCLNHQGIVNISRGSAIFSFRKRSKIAKMAEHFEYNHIPAQLSSIHHFRVKSVVCFCDSVVVLHLSRNMTSQFGLLDLRLNKFLGVFGNLVADFSSDSLLGQISPDRTKCLIRLPKCGRHNQPTSGLLFQLYDLVSKVLLKEIDLGHNHCSFSFDPRFSWRRIVVTNLQHGQTNSLNLVQTDIWQVLATNRQACTSRSSLFPYLKDISYTPDGRLIVAAILDVTCFCRENKIRNQRPVLCSIYVFDGDTIESLHSLQYPRYVCVQHNCPVNYRPAISTCGSRMAFVTDSSNPEAPSKVFVCKLPRAMNLQNSCRMVILQNFPPASIDALPLPPKLIGFLRFKPEFD